MAIQILHIKEAGGTINFEGDIAPDSATLSGTPGTNAAVVVTVPAVALQSFVLCTIFFGYSAAPTGGNIKVESPLATVFVNIPVGQAFVHNLDFHPNWTFPVNTAVVFTLAAGGAAVIGNLAVNGFYKN